jgi:hypothetical protein
MVGLCWALGEVGFRIVPVLDLVDAKPVQALEIEIGSLVADFDEGVQLWLENGGRGGLDGGGGVVMELEGVGEGFRLGVCEGLAEVGEDVGIPGKRWD